MFLAVALAACSQDPPPSAPPPVVRTLLVDARHDGETRAYSGEVRARYEMPLSFRIGGKLLERRVDAGVRVKAGQVLARLDPADVALQSAQAEAQRTLAEAEARRFRDLKARNFVSQAAVEAKEAALQTAQAQTGLSRNQAAYATLAADHAGVVAKVEAEPGQVLAAGQPVLRLARDGEREVAIAVPEAEIGRLRVGAEAEVSLWADGKAYRGRVREVAPAADPATRTFALRVALPEADENVALGMTAAVRFKRKGDGEKGPVFVVPVGALFQQGERPAVWVVGADQGVALRPVTVAEYADAGAVVTAGLAGGERIVAAGVHKLVAGQKVRPAEQPR